MRSMIFSLIFCLVISSVEITEEENVLILTNDNFDTAIKENDYLLVEFYAPWCGHCKALAPEYAKAATELKSEGSNVKLGKVDATVESALGSKYQVQGYPTLKFFKKGNMVEYNGGRTSSEIISWLKKKTGPPMLIVTSLSDIEKAKAANQLVGVVIASDLQSEFFKTFEEAASTLDFLPFLHLTDETLVKSLDGKNPSFILFKKFDEPKVVYEGKINLESVKEFLKKERVALVTEFSQETAQVVFDSDIKLHILAFSAKESTPDYEKHMLILKDVAKKFLGKLHVVMLNMDDSESPRIAEFFNVEKSHVPTFRILNLSGNMIKYLPDSKDFTESALSSFTQDVIDGKVKPFMKSQDEPSDWNEKPVKVLVAKTFKDRAIDADKSVFIEFYAPWCGHCKALTPIWDQLGEKFKDDSKIVIAKMDATENEIEEISVQSFPTLKYSPQGTTEFVDYKGGRTIEALEKFVKSDGKEVDSDAKEEKHDEL